VHARSSGLQAMEVADGGGAKVDGLVVESPENLPRWLLPLDFEQKCRSRLVCGYFSVILLDLCFSPPYHSNEPIRCDMHENP
jgi:hypothetical protein